MQKKLLGYDERLVERDGEYDYVARSYIFDPIHETPKGFISTQSLMTCRECRGIIKYNGGPGMRSVCLDCYPAVKVRDFAEGHTHVVQD